MNNTTFDKDVVIIGAGISGLATAYRLARRGLDVLLLEKSSRTGGAILTENSDGFLVDCGPNSTLETSPKIRQFVDDLGLADSRVYANEQANRRYILRDGELQALPMSPPQFLASKLFSAKAKLRLLKEPFIAPAPPEKEETIAEFVERRLGREFLDYAINPFIAGVYAGDPGRLSVRSAVSKIYALEEKYGSLIKGAIKGARERKQRAEVDKTKARLFSFRDGMTTLVDALQKQLGAAVLTNISIDKITPPHAGARTYSLTGEHGGGRVAIHAKSIVLSIPAFTAARLLDPLDQELAKKLDAIVYPPVAMVFLGYKNRVACRPLDGFGFLVPKVENRKILGTIWSSTIFPDRAPETGIALTTFVGGMRQPEIAEQDDDAILQTVVSELRSLLALEATPDVVRIKLWQRAIPQYELGHQQKMQAIADFERSYPGMFISGNYRGGISVGDCILQSEKIAESVYDYVSGPGAREAAPAIRSQ